MQVSKWGNSLAVRLPAAVVDALGLKESDEINSRSPGCGTSKSHAIDRKERALEAIRRLARPFPPGFRFHREEANER